MGELWNDIKHALHLFVKSPAFTVAAVSALALGIGANTAIFSVVNAVLLKPLGYPTADRLVQFELTSPQGNAPVASIPKFQVWQEQTQVFEEVAAHDFAGPGFNITGDRPELVHGIHVTEGYFRALGEAPMLGRTFTKQEDAPHGGNVAVISYGLWQRRFGGDPKIVGKTLPLGNDPYTIIGVMGRDFHTDPEADIWVPFQFEPNSTNQGHFFLAIGLLKPGVTLAQANAQMKLAWAEFKRKFPAAADNDGGFAVQPLRDSIVSGVKSSLMVLLGAVGLVLLIACANVANLLLVRATGRKREFAIRSALGASRTRIIRQLLTESVLLAVFGSVLGLLLGFLGVRALLAVSPAGLPRIGENGAAVGLDWRVLVFTLLVAFVTGILFGLFPALSASKTDLNTALKDSSNRSGISFRQGKTRSLLVISEVGLALVLLVGASLLIRTYIALRGVNPGFDPHHVLTMEMALTGDRYQHTAAVAQLVRDGRERLLAIPGVENAASACCLPLQGGFGLPFNVVGRPTSNGPYTGGAGWSYVTPGYFETFKIPIVRGRAFTDKDTTGAPGVALINQAFAKQYFPKSDPIGQQIIIGKGVGPEFEEPARQIVGIVGDIHDGGLNRDPGPLMIVPMAQVPDGVTKLNAGIGPIAWLVRAHGDPRLLTTQITEQLRQASGGFPVARIRPMDEVVARSTARETFSMILLGTFGAVALILASIGIYGLMAYSVQQRTQEIGIRMTLGASPEKVRLMVVKQGMLLAGVGVVIGVAGGLAITRVMRSLLFGVKPWDPLMFSVTAILLAIIALPACYVPARRASRVDPLIALRYE